MYSNVFYHLVEDYDGTFYRNASPIGQHNVYKGLPPNLAPEVNLKIQ